LQTIKQIVKPYLGPLVRPILKRYKQYGRRKLIHFIFIPTYLCQYRCPYCEVWALTERFKPVDVEEWLRFFNNQASSLVDCTGGEPFLYEGWVDFVLNLSQRHRIAVTTNLGYKPSSFKDLWPRFSNVTVSFHPHTVDLERFLESVLEVKALQRNIGCNIVAYPDQLEKLPSYIEAFNELSIPVHVDPYISEKYQYTIDELNLLEKIREMTGQQTVRMKGFNFDDRGTLKLCNAGRKHVLVLPDGSSFTCMCGFFQNAQHHSMGNIFDRNWTLRDRDVLCQVSCSCGCDLDWVKYRAA